MPGDWSVLLYQTSIVLLPDDALSRIDGNCGKLSRPQLSAAMGGGRSPTEMCL